MRVIPIIMVLVTCMFSSPVLQGADGEGSESENDFLEFYNAHKEFLNKEAPYDNSLESFAEHHDALLEVVMDFEKSIPYEDQFPVEGKVTDNQRIMRSLKIFKLFIAEASAFEKGQLCFYGGWPSRTSGGKCLSPWKNKNDVELKKLGKVYSSEFYCGGENLFRCNPLFFGPGKTGKGICVKFKSPSEISAKCFMESRDQVEAIYEAFKTNPEFRRSYLATVTEMIKYCSGRDGYSACRLLTLQAKDLVNKSCGQELDLVELLSSDSLLALNQEIEKISAKVDPSGVVKAIAVVDPKYPVAIPVEENPAPPPPPKAFVVHEPASKVCELFSHFKNLGVPEIPLKQLMTYYYADPSKFKDGYISLADYSQNSKQKRFYLMDLNTGSVTQEKVSHGSGNKNKVKYGDRNHDGMLDKCTQSDGSRLNMTRPGFYRVENYYYSASHRKQWPVLKSGTSYNGLRMVGLSATNTDALGKGVVMHEANYNSSAGVMGRSYGCPAFVPKKGAPLMAKMAGGGLFYAYAPVCKAQMDEVLKDTKVKGWEETCK